MDVLHILKEIDELVSTEECKDVSLPEVFRRKTESSLQAAEFALLEPFTTNQALRFDVYSLDCHWWNFVRLLLAKLFKLAESLKRVTEEKDSLLNVGQQKRLKTVFEIVVSLGLAQHFPAGVGRPLTDRSTQWAAAAAHQTPPSREQKVTSLGFVLKCLVELRRSPTFRGLLVSNYLGDLLSATFALQLYDCRSFSEEAKDLIENTFQPLVFKELMLLLHNKNCSPRLRRGLGKILSNRITIDGGLVAFIRAVLDLAPGLKSPSHWQIVSALSKVLVHPHTSDPQAFRDKVFFQLLSLIYRSDAAEYMQVAVATVRTLYDVDPVLCRTYFIDPLEEPLKGGDEIAVEKSVIGLRNLCGLPSSQHWSLPPEALTSSTRVTIYALCSKTTESASNLKSPLRDLTFSCVANCGAGLVLREFIFEEPTVSFEFGDGGGVSILSSKGEEPDWENRVELLLQLLEKPGLNTPKVVYNLFKAALDIVAATDITGEKLLCAKLLAELSTHCLVHEGIAKDPTAIINFVKVLLKDASQSEEFACLGLMIVAAVLDDPTHRHSRDWSLFKQLVEPLEEFKKNCANVELRVLAEDIRGNILTRGVVSSGSSKLDNAPKSSVSDAIKEATDSLLPMRAHGLRTLSYLVRLKDPEAQLKKDVIFCLFKENLKEEDSYVYLSAVEGMASMSSAFPDETLNILCEQFLHAKNSETRLKVGEVLMKVVKLLGEMACVYKDELIHAMLVGARDLDQLVRASSLSNLGELLRVLSFRAHAHLVEILDCLTRIYESDKEAVPRRAAVMALTLLLKGFGVDVFTTLQDSLVPLRRAISRIAREDSDDITKLHAQLALEQLSASTMVFLDPPQRFEKRIFVLDPPQ